MADVAREIGVGRQPATARVAPVDVVLHDDLSETLSLDESYRAAFYFVLGYLSLEKQRSEGLTCSRSICGPARWAD
jgi:hypothetical protein